MNPQTIPELIEHWQKNVDKWKKEGRPEREQFSKCVIIGLKLAQESIAQTTEGE